MSQTRSSRGRVGMYLVFVFLFSALFYFLMLRAHALGGGGWLYVTGIMWCPALAASATLLLNGRSIQELGWRWPTRKYAAMFLPCSSVSP